MGDRREEGTRGIVERCLVREKGSMGIGEGSIGAMRGEKWRRKHWRGERSQEIGDRGDWNEQICAVTH